MRTSTRTRRHGNERPQGRRRDRDNGKPTQLGRLLDQRDLLSRQLHESEAHGYADAIDLAQRLGDLEDAIRAASGSCYRTHVARWADVDARREHHPGDPRPETCLTCAYGATTYTSR